MIGSDSSPSPKVLIADNDPANVQLLSDICLAENLEVVVALDGEETLSCIQADRPDLVLLDVMMPQMDGFEVLAHLRREPTTRTLPVILVTAVSDDDSIRHGYRLGANDYITKPFKVAELVSRMSTLIQASAFQKLSERPPMWDVGNARTLRAALAVLAEESAERPVSLLLLQPQPADRGEPALYRLAQSVRLQVRGVDSAHLVDPDRVAILLVDTDTQGAEAVARRLERHLLGLEETLDAVRWAVCTSTDDTLQGESLLQRALARLDTAP